MRKVLLSGPNGERWVEEGKPFKFLPGEKLVEDQNGRPTISSDDTEKELFDELQTQGIQFGDVISKLTKILNIPHCSRCEQRRRILNEAKKFGIKQTIQKLVETL